MPIATKTKTSLITPDFAKQIENNLKVDTPETVEPTPVVVQPAAVSEPLDATEKKGKYNDVANLHFTRGKKAEFKAFFSSHEVTLVQGVENAVNYIMKEVKAGRLTISRNGIEKVGE